MKVLHCADIHLDSVMSANLTAQRAKTRRAELRLTLERMLDMAVSRQVSVVVIAGDLFDRRDISLAQRNYVRELLARHHQLHFVLVYGNHDAPVFDDRWCPAPDNVTVCDSQWTTLQRGEVRFCGCAGTDDQIYSPPTDPECFNIVVLHGDIDGEIDLRRLKSHNIDYLALGHIHTHSTGRLDQRGIFGYSGCLDGRGFDETGPKGCLILDTDTRQLEFVPMSSRIFHELEITLQSAGDSVAKQACLEALADIPSCDLVSIKLHGTTTANLDMAYLTQALAQQVYFCKVRDCTRTAHNVMGEFGLRADFVRLVNQSGLDPADREQVIRYGLEALAGRAYEAD